jgi:hypothetical protein
MVLTLTFIMPLTSMFYKFSLMTVKIFITFQGIFNIFYGIDVEFYYAVDVHIL